MKTVVLVILFLLLLFAAVIFIFVAKELLLVVVAIVVGILSFYDLWHPPRKHKDFSLYDQTQATIRAGGGSGIPDLSQLAPREQKCKRKERRK